MSLAKIKQVKSDFDATTKIWSGAKRKLLHEDKLSIGQVVLESLLRQPQHINQICYHNDKTFSNSEIALMSIRVAQHLQQMQLQQGDVIGFCGVNSDYVAPLVFGVFLSGMTLSTLDASFDVQGIKHIFGITKPRLMFCDANNYERIKQTFEECKLTTEIFIMDAEVSNVRNIKELLEETGKESTYRPPALEKGLAQTAAILCSSGTTGMPKGVCMSHGGLMQNDFLLTPADIHQCFSTLYWVTGMLSLVTCTIEGCTRVISNRGYSPEDFCNIVQKYKVTACLTPPSQLAMNLSYPQLQNYELSSLKYYLTGGSAIPYSLVNKLKEAIPTATLFAAYGMSEVVGLASTGPIAAANCNGKLVPNFQLKILRDNGQWATANEVGEIYLKAPYPWQGYYNNPTATAALCNSEGWISSGDIGYMCEQGNIYVVDRKKDIMKYNNYHISPTEIEQIIMQLFEVSEVCVFGVPDLICSCLPAAAVVKRPGSNLTADDIVNHVAQKLENFKQLRGGVYLFESLPKTASGKLMRNIMYEHCKKSCIELRGF